MNLLKSQPHILTKDSFLLVPGCPRDARTNFNDKLVKFLSKQFMEYVKKSASSSGQVQGNKGIFALFKSFCLYHITVTLSIKNLQKWLRNHCLLTLAKIVHQRVGPRPWL